EPIVSGRTDAHGREIADGYRLVPEPAAAAVVRRIFESYVAGDGLRTIAHALNRDGIPTPRPRSMKRKGSSWAPSALPAMLPNPSHHGELVWNRSEWVKDHEHGRRRRYERPESEWVRQQDESWRIVPEDLWQRARAVSAARATGFERREHGRIVSSTTRAGKAR